MSKQKKIIIIPQAGLGNRMRVISSSIRIAESQNRSIAIAWPVNAALGCEMDEIFQSIGVKYEVVPKWKHKLLTNLYRPGAIRRFFKTYKFWSNAVFGASIFDGDILEDGHSKQLKDVSVNATSPNLLVASCLAFGGYHRGSDFTEYLKNEENRIPFKRFRFTEALEAKVQAEHRRIGENYTGLHIRRTDHVDLIRNSPFDNYITEIDRCIALNPEERFFLATDDAATRTFITSKYAGRIFTYNSILERDSAEGVQDAVVELLLLSRSKKIICSVLSSYSTTAILIGDIQDVTYV